MTKITTTINCGNSPKMEFIKQFNSAFAQGDVEFLAENVTDEIVWNILGDKKITGMENFVKALEQMKAEKVSELILEQILSHGKEGAASGIMKMENGNDYAFSDFYIFNNAKGTKVKSITSYVIKI